MTTTTKTPLRMAIERRTKYRTSKLTPREVGQMMAREGSLQGMPYGPGKAQDEAIRAYEEETLFMSRNMGRLPPPQTTDLKLAA